MSLEAWGDSPYENDCDACGNLGFLNVPSDWPENPELVKAMAEAFNKLALTHPQSCQCPCCFTDISYCRSCHEILALDED